MRLKSAFLPVSAVLLLAGNFLPSATASHAGAVPVRTDWDLSRMLPPPRAAQSVAVPFEDTPMLPQGED